MGESVGLTSTRYQHLIKRGGIHVWIHQPAGAEVAVPPIPTPAPPILRRLDQALTLCRAVLKSKEETLSPANQIQACLTSPPPEKDCGSKLCLCAALS